MRRAARGEPVRRSWGGSATQELFLSAPNGSLSGEPGVLMAWVMAPRKSVPTETMRLVLAEAGYTCANPTCRNQIALDIHHLVEVAKGGGDTPDNLLALCPGCHALHTRGTIPADAVKSWKGIVVALNHAFDKESISNLLFLDKMEREKHGHFLKLSGDGVLKFTNLIAAGLAQVQLIYQQVGGAFNIPVTVYHVSLTPRGKSLIESWKSGDRVGVRGALAQPLVADE